MKASRRGVTLFALAILFVALTASVRANAADGVVITFVSGTGATGGSITVTNAATGSTTSSSLGENLPATVCANILSGLAPKIGLKAELDGASVRIFARGAIVKVVGATTTKADLGDSK
jgi:hypothetical protein